MSRVGLLTIRVEAEQIQSDIKCIKRKSNPILRICLFDRDFGIDLFDLFGSLFDVI